MVWNPVTGCTKVSEGCKFCYAERMAMRFTGHFNVTCHPDRLDQPLHWKKPRRIFVCSMGDLFHEDVPFEFINRVLAITSWTSCRDFHHTYLILTKRPERMAEYFKQRDDWRPDLPGGFDLSSTSDGIPQCKLSSFDHIWLGVTAENQDMLEQRWHHLQQIAAAKRFISMEPLLDGIDMSPSLQCERWEVDNKIVSEKPTVDWVIVGAESGPGRRECKLEWVRNIVGQCAWSKTPVFIKQLHINGKLSKNLDEWPEDLRVREYPA